MWYVLENPSSNKFSRVSSDAYRFLALLDGKRNVSEAWRISNEHYGDSSPTQGEVIQLLAQLFSSNLLYAELAPDTESLFNRYKTRIRREIQRFITNLLFFRIPLLDPDHFLDRWVNLFGRIFSMPGFVLWLLIVVTGLYFVANNVKELMYQSADVLKPDNLIFLYLSTALIKVFHEFGHAFACKRFGRLSGSGGQVHVMGVMFLVFVPLPYMDASSAWAFREKRHRAIVGLSGLMVELAAAAVAVVIWANTSTGTPHIIAYNIIFVASVSAVLFNGNPLLRFDAYYVLSDLVDIPNLAQRSKDYIYYVVKKYFWKVKGLRNPSQGTGEKCWLVFYGFASTFYRIYISIQILLFLNDRLPEELFILVPLFAGSAIVMWLFFPLGKFIRYLATDAELIKNRGRAVSSTLGVLALMVICLGIIRVSDYCRIEGIVEPVNLGIVYAGSDGFVVNYLLSGERVVPDGRSLIKAVNPALEAEKKGLLAELRSIKTRLLIAKKQEVAAVQILAEQIEALKEKIERVNFELSSLNLQSSLSGTWVSPDIEKMKGMYLLRGQQIGFVADLNNVMVRATAKQELAAMIVKQAYRDLEIRVKGSPDIILTGKIEKIFPAGHEVLPSEALGYTVGGDMPTVSQDSSGTKTAEKFFEIRIRPDRHESVRLLTGQRVVARIRLPSIPLASQWWRSARQLFQRRFHI
jgi:putative peptide zinc metalloprotease protein